MSLLDDDVKSLTNVDNPEGFGRGISSLFLSFAKVSLSISIGL